MVMQSSGPNAGDPELRQALANSVDSTPDVHGIAAPTAMGTNDYVIWIGTIADAILPWGVAPKQRDQQLRSFYPTENFLMSTVSTIAGRNAAFSWKLEGSEALVTVAKKMLLNANKGLGWESWVEKMSTDLDTQDSGAFTEIIRSKPNDPNAPVINFAHLDAARCYPTGDPETPLIFRDRLDRFHALKWFQIYHHLASPAPHENFAGPLYGLQFSSVSKVLKAAQIIKSISTYQEEKLSGRNESAIHLIRGIDVKKIEDALTQSRIMADSQGLTRYMRPAMVGSHNPEADVGHDTIELASLPPNFDLEVTMKWYISAMALAFGVDFQDLAPLQSSNLGSGQQSEVLHMKSRGKGPALWQKHVEHFMNESGVLPKGVTFLFDEQDMQAEKEEQDMKLSRATERQLRIASTEIDADTARQLALDAGDLTQEQYDDLGKRAAEQKAQADAEKKAQADAAAEAGIPPGALGAPKPAFGVPVAPKPPVGAAKPTAGPSDAQGKDNKPVTSAKERVPPGRIELEEAVCDPVEEIMTSVARKLTSRIRILARPEPMGTKEMDDEHYPPRKARRVLKTVTAADHAGRATQVLEEEIA